MNQDNTSLASRLNTGRLGQLVLRQIQNQSPLTESEQCELNTLKVLLKFAILHSRSLDKLSPDELYDWMMQSHFGISQWYHADFFRAILSLPMFAFLRIGPEWKAWEEEYCVQSDPKTLLNICSEAMRDEQQRFESYPLSEAFLTSSSMKASSCGTQPQRA